MSDSKKTNSNSEKIVTLTVDIPYALKDRLKFESYRQSKPIKEIVKESFEMYFEKISDN